MIFLPIVIRELRRVSRRPATYWGRAGVALVAGAWTLWVLQGLDGSTPTTQTGPWLFRGLSRLGFFVCLMPGAFLTADCLSQEKREGTLGLLLLTDLTGSQVVLSKLAATSLTAFFGMLAMVPLLALPLLLGGLTVGEVCRVALVWTNTLLFSLTTGLVVSAASWHQRRAVAGTVAFLLLTGGILPELGFPMNLLGPQAPLRYASSVNFQASPAPFIITLALAHGWVWLWLLWAPRLVRASWMHSDSAPPETPRPKQTVLEDYPTMSLEERTQLACAYEHQHLCRRAAMLESNPAEWLAQSRQEVRWLWGMPIALAMFLLMMRDLGSGGGWNPSLIGVGAWIFLHAMVKWWLAWEASARFTSERRTRLLELLLVTPLRVSDLIQAQARVLLRLFLVPSLTLLGFDTLLLITALLSPGEHSTATVLVILLVMAVFVADAFALAGLGMWNGLRTGRPWQATLRCLWTVLGLPLGLSTAVCFILATMQTFQGRWSWMSLLAVWGTISLLVSCCVGQAAWRELRTDFRRWASDDFPASR